MTEAIQEVIFPAIGLIFLLLGIVLLMSILFSAFNPYDQIAFINAEKLRAKIDEACITNSQTTLDNINLKQNTPSFTWAFSILPRWLIRSGGDPNYVLYYESFPPGEATGWEVYHDMQTRIITPIGTGVTFIGRGGSFGGAGTSSSTGNYDGTETVNDGTGIAGQSVVKYVKDVEKAYAGSDKIDSIIISNVILNEGFRADYRKDKKEMEKFSGKGGSFGGSGASTPWEGGPLDEEAKKAEQKFFSYGSWKNSNTDSKQSMGGDDVFVFSNYMSLSPSEKAAIKYTPCGVNSLCLKTRSGVYSFPLHQCNVNGEKINDIMIDYDADIALSSKLVTNIKSAAGVLLIYITKGMSGAADLIGIGAIASSIKDSLVASLSNKRSDFYFASPCTIDDKKRLEKITIEKKPCKEVCESYISYPIYDYDSKNQKLVDAKIPFVTSQDPTQNTKKHYVCTRSIGDSIDSPPSDAMPGKCIVINVRVEKSDYCWTLQPTHTGIISTLWNSIKQLYGPGVIASAALNIGYGYPVTKNTAFISPTANTNDIIVLNPTETALKEGEGFFNSLDRKLLWGWPGIE